MSAPIGKKTVEIFYDVVSPYSWIAFEVLCRYRSIWNIDLKLKPFLLGGIMQGSGNKPPAYVPNKGIYSSSDIVRLREYYKVPINQPANFAETVLTKGSLAAQRFLTAVDMMYPQYTENLSRELWFRIWNRDEDILDPSSLKEAAKKAGLSDDQINEALSKMKDQNVKDRLKKYTQDALDYGAFGAPTIVAHVDGKPEMLFGSDRFPILAQLLGEKWYGPLEELSKCKL